MEGVGINVLRTFRVPISNLFYSKLFCYFILFGFGKDVAFVRIK